MTVTINKWGNSLGIRIPKILAEQANLVAGKELTLTLSKEGELIFKIKEEALTLDDLIEGVTPENRHKLSINQEVGKEKWNY